MRLQFIFHLVNLLQFIKVQLQSLLGLGEQIFLSTQELRDHVSHFLPVLQLLLKSGVVVIQQTAGLINLT